MKTVQFSFKPYFLLFVKPVQITSYSECISKWKVSFNITHFSLYKKCIIDNNIFNLSEIVK
jgi:hypothetical protein